MFVGKIFRAAGFAVLQVCGFAVLQFWVLQFCGSAVLWFCSFAGLQFCGFADAEILLILFWRGRIMSGKEKKGAKSAKNARGAKTNKGAADKKSTKTEMDAKPFEIVYSRDGAFSGGEVHAEIVNSIVEQMPETDLLYDLAELYRIFADSTRIRILYVLFENEVCVCDIAAVLNMTVSAVSHQLRILRGAHLIRFRREGKVYFYSLADDHVKTIIGQGMEHLTEG